MATVERVQEPVALEEAPEEYIEARRPPAACVTLPPLRAHAPPCVFAACCCCARAVRADNTRAGAQENTFDPVEKLTEMGVSATDVKKLKDAGFFTVQSLSMRPKKVRVPGARALRGEAACGCLGQRRTVLRTERLGLRARHSADARARARPGCDTAIQRGTRRAEASSVAVARAGELTLRRPCARPLAGAHRSQGPV
jgi:hypothetical protein